jgi:hypothetical protein
MESPRAEGLLQKALCMLSGNSFDQKEVKIMAGLPTVDPVT